MPNNTFKIPQISVLAGSTYPVFRRIVEGRSIAQPYQKRYGRCLVFSRLMELIAPLEQNAYLHRKKKLKQTAPPLPPVFILGHWRSGTTHLHNLMCQDQQFGYVTTYHGVLPNALFYGKPLFKYLMRKAMPSKRATDNVKLSVNYPQEEEFAIGNMCPHSFYNFWYFPQRMMEYAHKYLLFEGLSPAEKDEWASTYQKLVDKAMVNTKGKRFISKNPPHTSRVKELLELYPDARFIHITRNPYTVFNSTVKFFMHTIEPLKFEDISQSEMERNVLSIHAMMFEKYEREKSLIPEGHLVEICFEELESNPIGTLESLYRQLGINGFQEAQPAFEQYISQSRGYKKNIYTYDEDIVHIVTTYWGDIVDKWKRKVKELNLQ